jgi:hypothetical protein
VQKMWADYLVVCHKRENEGYLSDGDDSTSRDSDKGSGDGEASGDGNE